MFREVESRLHELRELCTRLRVQRLEIFGSGARESERGAPRDLDFLVEFETLSPAEYADAYFGMLEGLEAIFEMPIDLVTLPAIKNPYFIEGIAASRTLLYAA